MILSQYNSLTFCFLFLVFAATAFCQTAESSKIKTGAERLDYYLPVLEGKRVALVVNQTSICGNQHLVDALIASGVNIKKIFAPEHGFRGTADAGASIKNAVDTKTGLPVLSLYGKNKKPSKAQLADIDLLVFDIQDVGARFYTYISTMHYVMEAAAESGKKVLVLDRPNPNGHYVDGPVLDLAFQSFVGMHPIPVVHGLTVGELACMINGEGWLKGGLSCDLEVVNCLNYSHDTFYDLPVKPSPNLPNYASIFLYPSLCFFEGTTVSVGRGTDKQFQVIGAPKGKGAYHFTPSSKPGAGSPKHKGVRLTGRDLSEMSQEEGMQHQFQLGYLLDFYKDLGASSISRPSFFDKLAGTDALRKAILAGKSEAEIRASWEPKLSEYKKMREQYLKY